MKTNLLSVITSMSIYHGCSNWMKFCEEKFTPANMKSCCCRNVKKHREIKDNQKYITLDISLNFGRLYNMEITYS